MVSTMGEARTDKDSGNENAKEERGQLVFTKSSVSPEATGPEVNSKGQCLSHAALGGESPNSLLGQQSGESLTSAGRGAEAWRRESQETASLPGALSLSAANGGLCP